MKINDVEKILGVPKATIRFYEKEGLLTPKRNANAYREYSQSDIELLKKIVVLRKIGVPVEEILFLDDNYNADKTAKQAGMKVCGVYDDSSSEYETEIRSITDYYIKDFSELLSICFS